MASLGELIAYFVEQEKDNVENVSPLIEDSTLRNGLVAWKSVPIAFKAAVPCEAKSDVDKWNWMWNQIEYNHTEFGVIAGLKTQDTGNVLCRLIGLRLIYPDGSINKMARQFLQAQILQKLAQKKTLGRPKKELTLQRSSDYPSPY